MHKDLYRPLTFTLITLGFLIVYLIVFDSKIDLNGDNANYYVLGKALHQGEGYVNLNNIDKPQNNHFPPGYPVLISFIMIFSDSFVAIKLVNGLFLVATLFLSLQIIRQFTNNLTAFLVLPFLLFNRHLLHYSTMMMTEVPYLFFSLVSFYLFFKATNDNHSLKWHIPAFLSFMISFYLRTLGIAILAAYSLVLIFNIRRTWKIVIAYNVAFILCFLPWLIRSLSLGGNSYLRQLIMVNPYRPPLGELDIAALFNRIVLNFERYITREIPEVLFPFKNFLYTDPISPSEWVIGIVIVAVLIVGLVSFPHYKKLITGYLVTTFAILLIWPEVWMGIRFILPLLPFLLMIFLVGVEVILNRASKSIRLKRPVPVWVVLALALFLLPEVQALHVRAKSDYKSSWRNYFSIARTLRSQDSEKMVVSCRKPFIFHLFSNTYTTSYKFTDNPNELISDLQLRKADYVIIEQLGYSSTFLYLYPAVRAYPERFEILIQLESPDTFLLRFNPPR